MPNLCNRIECTGCGACYNACPKDAISMQQDKEGFLYPKIDNDICIECKKCEKVCPILGPIYKNDRAAKPFAMISRSEDIRRRSSSGGMFTLLAQYVIGKNGVVFGASYTNGFNVAHLAVSDEKELDNLRGSKYMQSDTSRTYLEVKQWLKNGRIVLYTGTPCQIAGLYKFLGKSNVENLYTADLVCHGVPSGLAFNAYLKKLAQKMNIDVKDIHNFSFRVLERWGYAPSFQFTKTEIHQLTPKENLYMMLFLSSRLHRESCYHCKFTTPERIADVTMADFWGIGKDKPYKHDTSRGCSLVLANTEKGKALISELEDKMYIEEREWDEALLNNTQLHTSSIRPKDRDEAYTYLFSHDYDTVYNHYFNTPYLRLRRMVGKILRTLHLR